jgi:Icc-related predicted phosphoesterase
LRATRKGVSSVGKYEFGPYKVISGKGGIEKTTRKSPLFTDDSSIKSSPKKILCIHP